MNEGTALVELAPIQMVSSAAAIQPTTISSEISLGAVAAMELATEPAPMPDSTGTVAVVIGEAPETEGHEAVETDAEENAAADLYEDPLDAIERHLAVLGSGSASEDTVSTSTDALLTALGGAETEARPKRRRVLSSAGSGYLHS